MSAQTAPGAMAPITCGGCGAALPLAAEPTLRCRHCGAEAPVPPAYLEALALQREARAARVASEPQLRRLALGSAAGWQVGAGAALVLLPPLATALGRFTLGYGAVEASARLMLPSLFIGLSLWTGASTARRLTTEFQSEMAARPPSAEGRDAGCRRCGAPLRPDASAAQAPLSATCGYCGTESLLIEVPTGRVKAERRAAQRTLAQASGALRRRMRWLAAGVVGAGLVAALFATALLSTLAPS